MYKYYNFIYFLPIRLGWGAVEYTEYTSAEG